MTENSHWFSRNQRGTYDIGCGDEMVGTTASREAALLWRYAGDFVQHAREFVDMAGHVDRTDFTGRDHGQMVRNYRDIFTALVAKIDAQPTPEESDQ